MNRKQFWEDWIKSIPGKNENVSLPSIDSFFRRAIFLSLKEFGLGRHEISPASRSILISNLREYVSSEISEVKFRAYVTKEFGGKIVDTTFSKKLPAKPMMTFEFEVDRSGDIVEWAEAFQEELEGAFEEKHYIIAGFKDFKSTYEEDLEIPFEKYDQFFVYGLCHFTYSYNIFNKGRPDAGIFAPCAMYFYIEKDSNKMIVGMPRLSVWSTVMGFKDPAKIEWTKKLDDEIISIMTKLGGKEL